LLRFSPRRAAAGGRLGWAGPDYDGERAQTADLDLEEITRGKYDFKVAGRSLTCRRKTSGRAQWPATPVEFDAGPEG
jgi:hypothetical protein